MERTSSSFAPQDNREMSDNTQFNIRGKNAVQVADILHKKLIKLKSKLWIYAILAVIGLIAIYFIVINSNYEDLTVDDKMRAQRKLHFQGAVTVLIMIFIIILFLTFYLKNN